MGANTCMCVCMLLNNKVQVNKQWLAAVSSSRFIPGGNFYGCGKRLPGGHKRTRQHIGKGNLY